MKLDVHKGDVAAAVREAQRLGATKAPAQYAGRHFVTMLDPEGHPFCLCAKGQRQPTGKQANRKQTAASCGLRGDDPIHREEQEERQYLAGVVGLIRRSLVRVEKRILDYAENIVDTKRTAWENRGGDPVERAAYRIAVSEQSAVAELSLKERRQLQKLALSPYFGRVDFAGEGDGVQVFYIGIHAYYDDSREVVVDWRAPLASIFYDYENGPARYLAPEGEVCGFLSRKRQYHIRDGELQYMLESSLNIGDDILQQELSRASDEKMKNIVATIQKEQNRIIRNDSAKVLLIQGAAGSGKTSIALHRVAFLLYRHKQTLRAEHVLILSPSKVFGSYIAGVLPELGEENIPQLEFEELARQFLGRGRKFQTFAEQVNDLLEQPDDALVHRTRYKAAPEFVGELDAFFRRCVEEGFVPADIEIGLFRVDADALLEDYRRLSSMAVFRRLEKIAADRVAAWDRIHPAPLPTPDRRKVKEAVRRMFRYRSALAIYKAFLQAAAGKQPLFKTQSGGRLEYADVFPLAYLTLLLEGTAHSYADVQHLLVDEMQDYTPIQYAFLAQVFHCRMTILGDGYQNVNPHTSTTLESIRPHFPGCEWVELQKSYRSTWEIVRFAQCIRKTPGILPMERHGEEPVLTGCGGEREETHHIRERIRAFRQSEHRSMGIVCKTRRQAQALHTALADPAIHLLDFGSGEFHDGVVIACAHMAKGLEFDWVLAPGCSGDHYRTELDRSMLYIACTRAMHRLELCFHGEQSPLIPPGSIWFESVGADGQAGTPAG